MKFSSFLVGQPTNKKNVNTTLDFLMNQLLIVQKQLRCLRDDNQDINRKLERMLIDKHLQMQVDEYFNDSKTGESN